MVNHYSTFCANLFVGYHQTSEKTLDAPDLLDDYYLNLLDWGSRNVLAIALGNTVYLWNETNRSTSELVTVDDEDGPVTSVSWAPDGQHIAVGLNNSEVQLWDTASYIQVYDLKKKLYNKLVTLFLFVSTLLMLLLFAFAVENFERGAQAASWVFGMEQSHTHNWGDGWYNCQQRRKS